jgi:hypothetical protein
MRFFAKKAQQKPTVGFSFLAAYGKIVPVMRHNDTLPAPKRDEKERENMKELAQKETKRTKTKTPSLPSFASVKNDAPFDPRPIQGCARLFSNRSTEGCLFHS